MEYDIFVNCKLRYLEVIWAWFRFSYLIPIKIVFALSLPKPKINHPPSALANNPFWFSLSFHLGSRASFVSMLTILPVQFSITSPHPAHTNAKNIREMMNFLSARCLIKAKPRLNPFTQPIWRNDEKLFAAPKAVDKYIYFIQILNLYWI